MSSAAPSVHEQVPAGSLPPTRSVIDRRSAPVVPDNQGFADPSLDFDEGWLESNPSLSAPAPPSRSVLNNNSSRPLLRQDDIPSEPGPDDSACELHRRALLNNPITEIALDVSPPPRRTGRGLTSSVSRTWRDRFGNPLVTGELVDMRRGYLIIRTEQGNERISYWRISEADLAALAEIWHMPSECVVSSDYFVDRCWTPQMVYWHASSLCHKTLFFEDVKLERYGHSAGPVMQPLRSTAHFFVSLLSIPYQAGIHPPNECQYALGYYRPGNCAPWLRDPIPISLNGAMYQASVVTGGAFILP